VALTLTLTLTLTITLTLTLTLARTLAVALTLTNPNSNPNPNQVVEWLVRAIPAMVLAWIQKALQFNLRKEQLVCPWQVRRLGVG